MLSAMIEAAIANDVMLMEAFMYRCHPQTAKLVELIKSKAIGDVRLIQASFGFHAGFNAERPAPSTMCWQAGGFWMSVAIRFRCRD